MLGGGWGQLTQKTMKINGNGLFEKQLTNLKLMCNVKNSRAISALHRALEADPGNIEALLDAGVSYTNELVQVEALQHLQNWLR
jgi:thioredoxin-like negative regulator of GroEL